MRNYLKFSVLLVALVTTGAFISSCNQCTGTDVDTYGQFSHACIGSPANFGGSFGSN